MDRKTFAGILLKGGSCRPQNDAKSRAEERKKFIVNRLFDQYDADSNGSVNLREFLIGFDYWTKQRGQSSDQKQALFFKFFDVDQNGRMDKEELQEMILCEFYVLEESRASWRCTYALFF